MRTTDDNQKILFFVSNGTVNYSKSLCQSDFWCLTLNSKSRQLRTHASLFFSVAALGSIVYLTTLLSRTNQPVMSSNGFRLGFRIPRLQQQIIGVYMLDYELNEIFMRHVAYYAILSYSVCFQYIPETTRIYVNSLYICISVYLEVASVNSASWISFRCLMFSVIFFLSKQLVNLKTDRSLIVSIFALVS